MKILVVSRWLWEERRRNDNKAGFFGELFQALVAKGANLTILSQAAGGGPNPVQHPVDGLNVYLYSRTGRIPGLVPFDKLIKFWSGHRKAATDAKVIRRFIRSHGPFDAVLAQCEEPDGLACAIASRAGWFPPLITAVHDLRYDFRADHVRFTHKPSLKFVFRHSSRIVANSAETATWLQREYGVPAKKIGAARIHLTAPFLLEAAKNPTPVDSASQRVVFLGALNRKKAPDIFLRAAALIAPDFPNAKFILVGPETSEDLAFHADIKKLATAPRLASQIEMPGRLDTTAIIAEIRRARVVVCPSRIETFSRTTVEALALGRPVIVTETTGAAHWVKSTGCGSVIPPGDPTALAAAIREWLTRTDIPSASATVTASLTAAHAADDWLREISLILPAPAAP